MIEQGITPEYKARLKAETLDLLVRKGRPVSKTADIYGWMDSSAMQHIRNTECVWAFPEDAILIESDVETFGDTYNGNNIDTVTTAYFASCSCGAYTEVPLRLDTTLSDLMISLFE